MVNVLNDSDSEDELPPGWEERATLDGNVYYVKFDKVNCIQIERNKSKIHVPESSIQTLCKMHKIIGIKNTNRKTTSSSVFIKRAIEQGDDVQKFGVPVFIYNSCRTWFILIFEGEGMMKPPELPSGWEKCVSEDGKVIFVDHMHRTTTYTDPRLAFATEYRESSQPLRQRFDASSTALAVLHGRDLRGKLALVTGANTGIGFETARSLAFHGCNVILACRNSKKAQEAAQKIQDERENTCCDTLQLDLTSLHSVREAAERFKQKYRTLDILILNAGVFALPYTLTEDGYETTFQVNHLSHYYLTLLLEHPLRSCRNSRIVVVSSESHRFSSLQSAEDIHPLTLSPPAYKYWSMGAYNDSKLCNMLFAQELAKRWPSVSVLSCHPGNMVSSDLSRYSWAFRLLFTLVRPFTKSLQQAASTQVFCAAAPELEGTTGIYFNNCYRCEPSNASQDSTSAARLWSLSQEMIINVVKRDKLWYDLALK